LGQGISRAEDPGSIPVETTKLNQALVKNDERLFLFCLNNSNRIAKPAYQPINFFPKSPPWKTKELGHLAWLIFIW